MARGMGRVQRTIKAILAREIAAGRSPFRDALDHPKIWGVVNLIALAVSFTPTSVMAKHVCLFLACITWTLMLLGVRFRSYRLKVLAAVLFSALGAIGLFFLDQFLVSNKPQSQIAEQAAALIYDRIAPLFKLPADSHTTSPVPSHPPTSIPRRREAEVPQRHLKLIFKESPSLTPARKQQITDALERFYLYLADLGLEVPQNVPPIGTTPGTTSTYSFDGISDPVFDGSIQLAEARLNDPDVALRAYADYTFRTMLFGSGFTNLDRLGRTWSQWIFVEYFTHSFENREPSKGASLNGWELALWDMRKGCGQKFTDRVLAYTVKAFGSVRDELPEPDDHQHFNKYFYRRLLRGIDVVDNNMEHGRQIHEILRDRGLAE